MEEKVVLSEDLKKALMDLVNRIEKEAQPVNRAQPPTIAEANYIQMRRMYFDEKVSATLSSDVELKSG